MDTEPITPMSEDEAWDHLAEQTFGRLALAIGGQPEIFPINYTLDRRTILFRTAEGTKLLGIVIDSHVAFEIDRIEGDGALSVVAKGIAREIEHESEAEQFDLSALRPWVPTLKYHLIAVEVTELSGRRFRFGPEPERQPVM